MYRSLIRAREGTRDLQQEEAQRPVFGHLGSFTDEICPAHSLSVAHAY